MTSSPKLTAYAYHTRWIILGLLFLATVINFIDRQTLSILAPTLRRELSLSESDYANVVTAFLISYTVMYSVAGRLLDRFGVRLGLAACVGWWSLATMLTARAASAFSLATFRFLLGVGEPGIFPGGVKVCGEWFPQRLRAFAIGFFSSGSAVGALLAPPLIAWITLRYGWRMAFLLPGAIGFLWIPLWLLVYQPNHEKIKESAETFEPARSWGQLLRERRVWALVLPRLVSDPVWYLYLFWLPDYLQRARGLSLKEIGLYGWIPFLFADFGAMGGGALSDWLIRRGWRPHRARIALLVTVGCLAPLGALVGFLPTALMAIALTCLIAFLTQCWATNTSALTADTFPGAETGTVAGMMGTAGSLGGILFAQLLGVAIAAFGYSSAFVLGAVMHPLAVVLLLLLFRATRNER
ncbi:MAG: MFS transporter [Acidobacteria bacterium]|nr:MFS transporter [Acidobacteriota bacterium]